MYVVLLRETPDSDPIVIHNSFTDGTKLTSGTINQGINNIDSFDMEIPFTNVGYGHIKPMQTLIEVRNIKNNYLEFGGRLLNYADTMTTDGVHSKTAICEGVLGYLHDSSQSYTDFTGTPENLFIAMITSHNAQVETYKQFQLGVISLAKVIDKNGNVLSTDSTTSSNITAFITPENSSYDQIKSNLLDAVGGEIQVRTVGSLLYIDYVKSVGYDSVEDIGISRNLKSVTKKVDPSNIITRLIPLGKTISTEDQTDNERRTTIASANGGLIYVERSDLVAEFGIQTGTVVFDDITGWTPLKNAGIDWLNNQKIVLQQFTVEALDLFKIGKGVEEYIVGNRHKVVNPIMSINEWIRIIGKSVDIVNPVNSTLTIGDKIKTLIDYQREQRIASKNYANLQNVVTQQKSAISSLSTGLSSVQNTVTSSSVSTLPQDLQTINIRLDNIEDELDALPTYYTKKYIATIGDDVSTSYTITHNMGTRDVVVSIRDTSTPYRQKEVVSIDYTSVNSIIVTTATPIPSASKLSVTILG